jgi:hypothetical protein
MVKAVVGSKKESGSDDDSNSSVVLNRKTRSGKRKVILRKSSPRKKTIITDTEVELVEKGSQTRAVKLSKIGLVAAENPAKVVSPEKKTITNVKVCKK